MKEDTIAAIATPAGSGGIGIVRISGKTAKEIALRIFRQKDSGLNTGKKMREFPFPDIFFQSKRKLHLGVIVDPESESVIDEALIVFMPAPNSYTCEDVIEIQAHAGTIGLKKVMDAVIKCGARIAEPGEFTKRAFLNGRMDLTQAEAVMEVINARTEKSHKIAALQLTGGLRETMQNIIDPLQSLLAEVEVSIDFSEDVEDVVESNYNHENLKNDIIFPIKTLLKNYEEGHHLRDGVRMVILGRPNVGKSSMMNQLLKKERAIVTPIPGTTRDSIEESLNINGLSINVIDTAGVHNSQDPVEVIGIGRTERIASEADIILFMVDGNSGITTEDRMVYEKIKEKTIILVVNKMDLAPEKKESWKTIPEKEGWRVTAAVPTSVIHNEGIDKLKDKIYECCIGFATDEETWLIPNLRQKTMLEKSLLAEIGRAHV